MIINTLTVLEFRGEQVENFLGEMRDASRGRVPSRLRLALEIDQAPDEAALKVAVDGETWSLPVAYPTVTQSALYDDGPGDPGPAIVIAKCGCEIIDGELTTNGCATHFARPF